MTNLSARQYRLLQQCIKMKQWALDEARKFNQATFGSLIHRGYLRYFPKTEAFCVSDKGFEAMAQFHEAEILRKIDNGKMSHYFDRDYQKIRSNIIQFKKNKVA